LNDHGELGEVPNDWRKANVIPTFKKGKKDHQGNHRLVSLSSIPGKAIIHLILGNISRHVKEKR